MQKQVWGIPFEKWLIEVNLNELALFFHVLSMDMDETR
jgi:hypothetical protein